jgi:6-pyruvoyltetrahydropterin/6-carboxytetrahydropterin synthase
MFRVRKRIDIESAHQLDHLPKEHKCHNLHGHSYGIEIVLASRKLDQNGMVLDFDLLSAFVKQFDHRCLNEFFEKTTAERFCKFIADGLEKDLLGPINANTQESDKLYLLEVTVHETKNNVATWLSPKVAGN